MPTPGDCRHTGTGDDVQRERPAQQPTQESRGVRSFFGSPPLLPQARGLHLAASALPRLGRQNPRPTRGRPAPLGLTQSAFGQNVRMAASREPRARRMRS